MFMLLARIEDNLKDTFSFLLLVCQKHICGKSCKAHSGAVW